MPYDVEALRAAEFPWAADGHLYLDHAAIGPIPMRARRAHAAYEERRAEPFRLQSEDFFPVFARTRDLCARLVGAEARTIALMPNTSYGINVAAGAIPLRAGDVILSTEGEFPANVMPWLALERRTGAVVRRLPMRDRLPDEDALLRALDDPAVKVLALSWVSFFSGHCFDLAFWGAECRKRGIWFVVDGIQGLGAATVDLPATGVDLFACGCQKWLLSPWGTGFLYVREERIRELEPVAAGWMGVQGTGDFARFLEAGLDWHDDARRFEVVTLPFHDFVSANEALALFLELGPADVARHIASLATRIVEWAEATRGMTLRTPREATWRAGIVAVTPPDLMRASDALRAAGVTHTVREGAIRLSPHAYNTRAEVERALEILERSA